MEEIQEAIDALTPQSILRHVRKHPPGNFTVVTLGPKPLRLMKEFQGPARLVAKP